MELRGWRYTGRNLGPDFHRQIRIILDRLEDPAFLGNDTWGHPLQERLAKEIGAGSSGVIRTLMAACVSFGFLNDKPFRSYNPLRAQELITPRGQVVHRVAVLEQQAAALEKDPETKKEIAAQIKSLYEEVYCDAMRDYCIHNGDGTKLHPLGAALRALERYGTLNWWEWYLLNTFVRRDGDSQGEALLDDAMERYRAGKLRFSSVDIVENPKGHQYLPQHFDFAGLISLTQATRWQVTDSGRHQDVKAAVLGKKEDGEDE